MRAPAFPSVAERTDGLGMALDACKLHQNYTGLAPCYLPRMRTVIFSKYYLANPNPRGKRRPSTWKMSPEDAAARGLTEIVPGTSEPREVPESEEEERRTQVAYQSAGRDSVQPPRK